MIFYYIVLIVWESAWVISGFIPESGNGQVILENGSQNFIQTSIFGRQKKFAAQYGPPLQTPRLSNRSSAFAATYDLPPYAESEFSGGTFAHLPFTNCFEPENSGTFDVAIVGHPFDLGVSYRPGSRFGPNGIRQVSRVMLAGYIIYGYSRSH